MNVENKSVQQYCDYLNEVRINFIRDRGCLSEVFNENHPLGALVDIDINVGDTHQDGRSTAVLHFESGKKTVYKPRSGGFDIAYNSLLEDLNKDVENIDLKTIKILDRDKYFWSVCVENLSCISKFDLARYYKRCGVLMVSIYLLRGTDIHFKNIIASGEYPVIVELECLFNLSK